MDKWLDVLSNEERTAFALRSLYAQYGYEKYRMSKFEEYDLYVRNKDFLVSDSVITFTDTDGKLLALKPDVTLSIIKNARTQAGQVMKVYYHENVYRVSKGTRSFKELMQAGLECMGDVDGEVLAEVLYLAAQSLETVSENNVLELSELSIVQGVLNAFGVSENGKREIVRCLSEKNAAGVCAAAEQEGLSQEQRETVCKLVSVYGPAEKVYPQLELFRVDEPTGRAIEDFQTLLSALKARGVSEKLTVDFSVLGDMKYYNGVAFKGFVEGIPTGILSGGQYDKLMKQMGKKGKAVGFAVYLDELAKRKN